jgi:DNA-binding response OmpR family regulator
MRRWVSRPVAADFHRNAPLKALVLEDDQKQARFLARVLSEEGFAVDLCVRGADAITQAERSPYDLVVLDWMVPDTDGLAVCREIRRRGGNALIMMLTARAGKHECVLGLEAGADDYMVKPFDVDEFLARVRALLRRASCFAALHCGDLEIDRVARQARLSGAALALTQREYALLLHLLNRANQSVTRTDLLAHIWDTRSEPDSNLVDVHISRLRDKLGDHAWMIETVRGFGYRLRCQRAP